MPDIDPQASPPGDGTRRPQLRNRRAPQVRPEQILDAAVEVLLAKGLSATTMDHIAGTAGIAKGTMYLYFDSKTQILAALRVRWVRRALVACNAAAAPGRAVSAIGRIQRFMEALYDATVADQRLLAILFREAGIADDTEIALVRDEVLKHIQDGAKSGDIKVRDPEFAASFLVYGVHGVFADCLADEAVDRHRTLTATRRIIRLLLEPGAAAG